MSSNLCAAMHGFQDTGLQPPEPAVQQCGDAEQQAMIAAKPAEAQESEAAVEVGARCNAHANP
eukprot:1160346-Pelagomonas_calceolata.AAC.3